MRHPFVRASASATGGIGEATYAPRVTRPLSLLAITLSLLGASPEPTIDTIPAGTTMSFHLSESTASNEGQAGRPFSFVVVDPVRVDGREVVASGAIGTGCILVAGHAGSAGHEGDITLRFDSMPTVDGREARFSNELLKAYGKNRKLQSGLFGLVPYVGIAARLIRGSDIRLDANTVFHGPLDHAVTIVSAATALPSGDGNTCGLEVPKETRSPAP